MKRDLTNDFSWSKSRHEKLAECARGYYLHYYASWGGWADDAPREARSLYVLKKLGNRFTWAGSVVHATLRNALIDIRTGRALDPAGAIERAHQQMRDDFRHSMHRAYWQEKNRRDFAGLIEHEYAEPVPPEQWKANWDQARAALEWFFHSRWIPLARSLRPEQWIEVDSPSFEDSVFTLDGVRVFAVPDFAYLDDAGDPVVVDWKTGKSREGYDEQVLGYALYLSSRYRFPVERVKATLVYLNDAQERAVTVDGASVARFQEHFRRSVGQMRGLLVDPAGNEPLPRADFRMTEDLATCARCVFRRPCGRAAANAPAPAPRAA